MKFLDLFAGIGGFRLGMESAGHECVGFCEIDKFARKSYKAIHNMEGEIELHDITRVSNESVRRIGSVDVICGGFPCQAFSIAGNRRGFEDTRGTLFFEIARFASILRPKYLFLENVKGLLNHDGGATFETILGALDELGYNVEWQVLNSKDFGVPQNRERVFIIGHLRGECTRGVFPLGGEGQKFDSEQLEIDIVGNTKNPNSTALGTSSVVYGSKGLIGTLCARDYKEPKQIAIPVLTPERPEKRQNGRRFKDDGEPMFTLTSQDRHGIVVAGKLPGNHDQNSRVYDPRGLAPTLSTMQGGGQENNLVKVVDFYNKITKDEVGTLTSSGGGSTVRAGSFGITDGYRIRKLTPRECWRLQGFPDWAFDKAQEVNSNSQLYKQAGNSVTVNVIEAISKKFE
ncbi:DNA cytosine methyltransferase [Streptococcus anginosus]|jgi:DNA (cytosine-5)-methyltransferase 1|uniref:DNA cytosine methyltransferase n=1 Tax=Streptococcus anginosus TaxID=1328 RepID=UPI001248CEF7|nr:DNA cytosine methyltransferase [Streptococcus anginosus]KAA9247416.1 DNA cytosine methyltransferase [Streptococcus anginosus]MCW0948545.1 DNA cytosine methyltransferase [Streptococcus anginosus]MED5789948.1 DNA cytosine methyltransferase [Streptococcus anginosus]MED5865921.1 DNA cytosine methyltransferase [Streptococcus anginosus]